MSLRNWLQTRGAPAQAHTGARSPSARTFLSTLVVTMLFLLIATSESPLFPIEAYADEEAGVTVTAPGEGTAGISGEAKGGEEGYRALESDEGQPAASAASEQAAESNSGEANEAVEIDEGSVPTDADLTVPGTDTPVSNTEEAVDSGQGAADGENAEAGETKPALRADAYGSSASITVSGLTASATLNVTLESGMSPAPGIYAHGDALASVSSYAEGDSAVIDMQVNGTGGESSIALSLEGAATSGIILSRVALYDTDGDLLASIENVEAAPPNDEGIMLLDVGASAPFVTDGYFNNTSVPTQHAIPTIVNAQTWQAAFCNDMNLNAPGDPNHGSSEAVWYSQWQFSSDGATAAQQGQNYLDFILFYGYPTDPTVGGRCSEADARAATQWAIWNFTNAGSTPTWEASYEAWSSGFWAAYDYLVQGAIDYNAKCLAQGATSQVEHGTCEVWTVNSSVLQNILTASPKWGWVDVAKNSTRPDLLSSAGYSLAGASFEVRNAQGTSVATLTTNDAGTANALLPVGTYTLVETQGSSGHDKAPDTALTISGGPVHVSVSVDEPAILGALEIMKYAGSEQGTPLGRARFDVISQATNVVVATLETNEKGWAGTGDNSLALGTYTLHEIEAPDGVTLAEDVTFEITAGTRTVKLSVVDPYNTQVRIEKLSSIDGSRVSGAHLQVLDDSGIVVEEWTSTEEAHVINGLAPGTYTLRETAAPAGYECAQDIPFTVGMTSTEQVITMTDERSRVPLSFTKTSSATGQALEGAVFTLYKATRSVSDDAEMDAVRDDSLWHKQAQATSGTDGRVDFGALEEGTYLLTEDQAPSGYQRPQGAWIVELNSVDGVSARSVGEVTPAPLTQTTAGLVLTNTPQVELPRAGGTGGSPLGAAGAAAICAGGLMSAHALRKGRSRLSDLHTSSKTGN